MDMPTIVVKPGEGRSVSLGGMGVVFKVSGVDTGGAFAVVEHPIEPGRLVLPHVHLHEDEYSYVLEGTIGARVGDREVVAGLGSYLIKPRGLMHTFWNAGPGPARLLEVIAPAGFEIYFVEEPIERPAQRLRERSPVLPRGGTVDWCVPCGASPIGKPLSIGRVEETTASFEARFAPRLYPTAGGAR